MKSTAKAQELRPVDLEGYFGPHLLVDAKGCPKPLLWDENLINEFLVKAIDIAEMELIMGPFTQQYFGKVEGDEGVTGIACLSESHISLHSFPERDGFITIDLYSCRPFNPTKLLAFIQETFQPTYIDHLVILRGEGFKRA